MNLNFWNLFTTTLVADETISAATVETMSVRYILISENLKNIYLHFLNIEAS